MTFYYSTLYPELKTVRKNVLNRHHSFLALKGLLTEFQLTLNAKMAMPDLHRYP